MNAARKQVTPWPQPALGRPQGSSTESARDTLGWAGLPRHGGLVPAVAARHLPRWAPPWGGATAHPVERAPAPPAQPLTAEGREAGSAASSIWIRRLQNDGCAWKAERRQQAAGVLRAPGVYGTPPLPGTAQEQKGSAQNVQTDCRRWSADAGWPCQAEALRRLTLAPGPHVLQGRNPRRQGPRASRPMTWRGHNHMARRARRWQEPGPPSPKCHRCVWHAGLSTPPGPALQRPWVAIIEADH